MNVVSACCKAQVVKGIQINGDPSDGGALAYKTEICEGCGEEHPETIETCECCGEEPDNRGFKKVDGSDWCHVCVDAEVDRLVEHLKAETGLAG